MALKSKIIRRTIRILIIIISLLLLFDLKVTRPIPAQTIILLDQSKSFNESVKNILLNEAKNLTSNFKIIHFAKNYGEEQNLSFLDNTRTNIAEPLKSLPSNSDVILISDGFENQGNVAGIIPWLRDNNIRVFPLVSYQEEFAPKKDCKITEHISPLTTSAQSSVEIKAVINNQTNFECTGALLITQNEKEIFNQPVTIQKNSVSAFLAYSDPKIEGKSKIIAYFTPNGQKSSKKVNFLTSAVKEKILILHSNESESRFITEILRNSGLQIDSFLESQVSKEIKYSDYNKIILNDFSILNLPFDIGTILKERVKNGAVVLTLGGLRSYGLGGYLNSTLEEILPVISLPPQVEQKRLNSAVILVVDKSKSMEQYNRLDFVKLAAKEVIKSLKDDDYLGLIAFDNDPQVVFELSRLANIRELALYKVDRFYPGGSTRLFKSFSLAGRNILNAPAGRKHIIVLTDGRLPDAGPMYVELAKQIRISGVTISTVLISDQEGTYPLKEMAEVGGGVFYVTNNPTSVPKIILEDIKVTVGDKTLKESVELDIKKGPAGIKSTKLLEFPRLKGYVPTKVKERADLELMIALPGQPPEPLLVSWQYEKGKVISFTSDLYGRWSNSWITWEKFGQFILDLLKTDSNKNKTDIIDFDVKVNIQGDQLSLQLAVYNDIPIQKINVTVNGNQNLNMNKLATGLYQSNLTLDADTELDFDVQVNDVKLPLISYNVDDQLLTEQDSKGFNFPLLGSLASQTNGEINPSNIPLPTKLNHKKYDLTYLFAAVLIILILLEVFVRERFRV